MIKITSTRYRVTPAVYALMRQGLNIGPFIDRHLHGDWGDINDAERRRNRESLAGNHGHILSVYHVTPEITLWITTKAGETRVTLPLI